MVSRARGNRCFILHAAVGCCLSSIVDKSDRVARVDIDLLHYKSIKVIYVS